MTDLTLDQPGSRVLLMGNEAIARGAIEAGVDFCSGYPGNPSSEIIECLAAASRGAGRSRHVEWSINEKVALEAAAAASFAGLRAVVTMKQNGLNVCADFLTTVNLTGSRGGLVLVVCDDPAALSSGNEQDSRQYARLAQLPLIEPATFQEAKEMTRMAFEFSERFGLLVIVRSVSRLSHGQGGVELGPIRKEQTIPHYDVSRPLLAAPPIQQNLHQRLLNTMEGVRQVWEGSPFNEYSGPVEAEDLVIASGLGWLCAQEAIRSLGLKGRVGLLKIGTPWPFPNGVVIPHLQRARRVLFVEEVDPFVEENVKILTAEQARGRDPIAFYGKRNGQVRGPFGPGVGELSTDIVVQALERMMGLSPSRRLEGFRQQVKETVHPLLIPRALSYCAGCPHRASFWVIKAALALDGQDGFVAGDIGCYGMAMGPTGFSQIKALHCMGSGYGNASGFASLRSLGFKQRVIAAAGDSTFFHAAIPALINAQVQGAELTCVVLDNGVTAMTGFQPHPGSTFNPWREEVEPIRVEALCSGLGLEVRVQDPFQVKEATVALYDLLQRPGVKVMIFRSPCVLYQRRQGPKAMVEQGRCIGDECGCARFCARVLGCPGNAWDGAKGKAYIDERFCDGCGLCIELCPTGAIVFSPAEGKKGHDG